MAVKSSDVLSGSAFKKVVQGRNLKKFGSTKLVKEKSRFVAPWPFNDLTRRNQTTITDSQGSFDIFKPCEKGDGLAEFSYIRIHSNDLVCAHKFPVNQWARCVASQIWELRNLQSKHLLPDATHSTEQSIITFVAEIVTVSKKWQVDINMFLAILINGRKREVSGKRRGLIGLWLWIYYGVHVRSSNGGLYLLIPFKEMLSF